MKFSGHILLIAIPIFAFFVLLEYVYSLLKNDNRLHIIDIISSLSSGLTNVTKDTIGLGIGILSYSWLLENLAIIRIEETWLTYIVAFIAIDFQGYWSHRWNHRINILWNRHVVHHSSEYFNLACALRQPVSSIFALYTFLLIPAAILGVPNTVILILGPLHLYAQFWYHTTYIGKMGFLEKIIVTPSHHRVHHAINPEYVDKNLSQIFIVWDKLFGTFQEELPDIKPVYGVTRQVSTWNPLKINYQHFWMLLKDAWRTKSTFDKIRIWFMPTGWRPKDVEESFPINKIKDPYFFKKYSVEAPFLLKFFCIMQLIFMLFSISFLISNKKYLGATDLYFFGVFIFLSIYTYTELMDRNPFAICFEIIKNMIGLYAIWWKNELFYIKEIYMNIDLFLIIYFIASMILTTLLALLNTKPLKITPTLP